ncbi:MAG: autotransporter-associated beta strand repeat-containing protein [Verrucomicrobiales bacterium]|nr:autotransporter-associated beta strand repeat-containing protein [Verrucomicrobiales bacterium]
MAQNESWDNGGTDGLWGTATNWTNDTIPGTAPGDVATFDSASTFTIIDLEGTRTSGGILFDTGADSFTIGTAGDILILSQSGDDTSNDARIDIASGVTTDQTIAADIVLGDGTGTTGFRDQININNLSANATLFVTGDISTGTGGTITGNSVQRLIWGNFSSGSREIVFSGDFNETDTATSASRVDMFVGGAELTWTGSVNTTTNNYLTTIIRDNGTLSLENGSNIGTGFMEIRSGTLNVNADQTFGNGLALGHSNQANGDASINIGGANTIFLDSNFTYTADDTVDNAATISGGTLHFTNDDRTFDIGDHAGISGPEVTISSNIASDTSNRALIKNGAGTLELSGANSHGNTTVNNGLLIASGGSALSDTHLLSLNQNGILGNLQLNASETIGSLDGDGGINLQSNTLTVGDADNTTYSGLISGTGGGLTKTGTGTLTLANTGAHTYTGDTVINQGLLNLEGSVTSDITVNTGGNIGGEGSTSGSLTFGAGTFTLEANALTSAALGTTGLLDVSSPTSITVNISGTSAGNISILEYGSRAGSGVANFVLGSNEASSRGAQFIDTSTSIALDLGYVDNTWVGGDGSNPTFWDVDTTENWTNTAASKNTVFLDNDTVTFDDTASSFTVVRQSDVTVENIVFNNSANDYALEDAGGGEILNVTGSITANGTGAVNINGAVNGTSGILIDGAGDITFGGDVSGSGGLIKNGTGTATIAAVSNYTGPVFVNEGTLLISSPALVSGSAASETTTIASGATLEFNTSGNRSIDAFDHGGDGTFLKSGTGQFNQVSSQSDITYSATGLIHIAEGRYQFGGATPGNWSSNFGSMRIDSGAEFSGRATSIFLDTLIGEGTFEVGGRGTNGDYGLTLGVSDGSGTFNGIIENSSGASETEFTINKIGSGTQSLNGNNTYTGDTTISAGQLNIGGTNASSFIVGTGSGTGANLGGEGSTSGNITFNETAHTLDIDATTDAALGLGTTGTGTLDVSSLAAGGFTVNVSGGALGPVNVLSYGSGTFTGDIDRFVLGTGGGRSNGVFVDDMAGNITIDLGNVVNTWKGNDSSNPQFWNVADTENWENASDNVFQQGDGVVFDDTASSFNVVRQEDILVDNIVFNHNSNAYTLGTSSGGELLTVINDITVNGTGESTISGPVTALNGMTIDGAGDLTFAGEISGSGGFTKNGTGTTTLTAASSYTGTVNVNEGTLILSNEALISNSSADLATIIASGATLEYNTSNGNRTISVFDHGGNGTFKKTGQNELVQTSGGSEITYGADGLIHVAEGIYRFGGATPGDWSSNLGDMQIDSGAAFQARSTSITIDALNGEGTFGVGGKIANGFGLTLGVSDGNGVFSGAITETTADGEAFSIEKVGSGTQSLNGDNTYTGATLISGGQLNIGGTNLSDITVGTGLGSGANIGGEGSTSGNLTFTESTHTLEIDASTTEALGTTGAGTTDWTALDPEGLTVNISGTGGGDIVVLTYGSGGINGSLLSDLKLGSHTTGVRFTGTPTFADDAVGNITINLGYENASWIGGSGNPTFWDVGTTANWGTSDTFFQTSDDVFFGDSASNFNPILQSDLTAGKVTFEADSNVYNLDSAGSEILTVTSGVFVTGDSDVNISAVIAGAGGLTLDGAGTTTLSGSNSYTGDTTINNGQLTIGASGVISDDSVVTQTGGTINFAGGVVETLHSVQSTGGTFLLGNTAGAGAADVTLNNDSEIRTIQVGTNSFLRLADGANLTVSSSISQLGDNDSLTLDLGVGSVAEVSGAINSGNGGGALDKSGAGTLRLTSDGSAWGGGTRITGGILEFTSISNVGSADVVNDSSLGNADTLNVLQIGSDSTAATLRMIGTNAKNTSDRLVQLGDAGGTIDVEDAGQTLTLNGALSNDVANGGTSGSLTKDGHGTLVLGGTNTYTGGTGVSTGTLLIDGDSSAATGNVSVASGATLGGNNGTIGGNTTVSGTLSAGTNGTISSLNFSGDLTMETGSTWLLDLVNDSSSADRIDVGGALTFSGSQLDVAQLSGTFTYGSTYTIASYSTLSGTFSNDSSGIITSGGKSWSINYADGGNFITLTAVPEPTTFLLLLPLLFAGIWMNRRRSLRLRLNQQ